MDVCQRGLRRSSELSGFASHTSCPRLQAAAITGFGKEEVMGRDLVGEFIAAEDRHSVQLVLGRALRGESTANFEFPLYSKSGARVDILLNATPRINSQVPLNAFVDQAFA